MSYTSRHALPEVDKERDTADYDAVSTILAQLDATGEQLSRRQWILYRTLFARGARIERADHEIARMTPRAAPK